MSSRKPERRLRLKPSHDPPLRWKAEQGEPTCVVEYASQKVWNNRIMFYVALVVTLTLAVQLAGLPWEWV